MARKPIKLTEHRSLPEFPLYFLACPYSDYADFNRFDVGNLSIAERMGKKKAIRRLYCKTCGHRFSEREGSLMAGTKMPEETVVRIIKCLGYGCTVEATADICEADPRTVERLLNGQKISIAYNWSIWNVRHKRCSWMNYMAGWLSRQKRGRTHLAIRWNAYTWGNVRKRLFKTFGWIREEFM